MPCGRVGAWVSAGVYVYGTGITFHACIERRINNATHPGFSLAGKMKDMHVVSFVSLLLPERYVAGIMRRYRPYMKYL